jgi:DMSO/TMAO reductase YedYZ molybdopterin-dependent catalytic subunit
LIISENRPGFYIRWINAIEPIDREAWRLEVTGLVKDARSLSLEELRALPDAVQRSRLKCVEGWSAAAQWEGFRTQALVDHVQPHGDATWVHFRCADRYYESLPLEQLLDERVLFAHGMNAQPLPDEYGAPLRLIVPFLYGYKGPKAIVEMEFSDKQRTGYWPATGPYSEEGRIEAGYDLPLDLGGVREHGAGEVVYEDGLESTS